MLALTPQTIELGNAKNYVILGSGSIATVPDSTVVGDIGVSPIAYSLTGLPT
jgi:hypothetical protein